MWYKFIFIFGLLIFLSPVTVSAELRSLEEGIRPNIFENIQSGEDIKFKNENSLEQDLVRDISKETKTEVNQGVVRQSLELVPQSGNGIGMTGLIFIVLCVVVLIITIRWMVWRNIKNK